MDETSPKASSRVRSGWLSGLVLGVVTGFAVLVTGFIGLAIGVLALLLIVWKGPRLAATGGLATGVGGVWTVLFGRVMLTCAAENLVPGQGCEAGSIGIWVAASVVILLVGLVTSGVAARRARR